MVKGPGRRETREVKFGKGAESNRKVLTGESKIFFFSQVCNIGVINESFFFY